MYCSFCHREYGRSYAFDHDTDKCPEIEKIKQKKERESVKLTCGKCGGEGRIRISPSDPFDGYMDEINFESCSACWGSGKL